jgi:hypothetical protein
VKGGQADVDSLADWLLKEHDIHVSTKKKLTKDRDSANTLKRKESFIGEDCCKLIEIYTDLMAHIFPDETGNNYTQSMTAWEAYANLWKALCTHIPSEHHLKPTQTLRDEKAATVDMLAKVFRDAFVKCAGQVKHCPLYMHVIVAHLGYFVKMYGNLMHYSAQGMEHLHVITKYNGRHASNRRPGQRTIQTMKGNLLTAEHSVDNPPVHRKNKRTHT